MLKKALPLKMRRWLREILVRLQVHHVSGSRRVDLADDEAAVTCVVKNGEVYLRSFIAHYLDMGFRHIFLLDNGSSDKTLAIAKECANVTVYRSDAPIGAYQTVLKKVLATVAVPDGWCLDVDIDEFFDYPFSNRLTLRGFLSYLNSRGFSAVLGQMLDMFSDAPFAAQKERIVRGDFTQVCRYYDLSEVTKEQYLEAELVRSFAPENRLAGADAALYFGGVRRRVFGINCLLTKHPLFHTGRGVDLFTHVHFANRARLADVSAILLHYKFVSDASRMALENMRAFPSNSGNYERMREVLESNPAIRFTSEASMQFGRVEDLCADGFVVCSPEYRRYAGVDCGRM
jgi:hypothetical protein